MNKDKFEVQRDTWLNTLQAEVAAKGPKQVARELGVSRTTVDLVCQGKYQASTDKIQERVSSIYGNAGIIVCPVLGEILPIRCAETWDRAKKIGLKCGNPETLRLYKTCINCSTRNH
jgi:hypothetical protein